MNTTVNKAVYGLLTGLVGVAALFVPAITEWVSPEIISAVTAVVTSIVVYLVPNKQA